MRFAPVTLKPGGKACCVVLHAITDDPSRFDEWAGRYGSEAAADRALKETKAHWRRLSEAVSFTTGDPVFDGWMRWVAVQPVFRKIYGNSYLPDFGYGRGGRGWRDLWSDLQALLLIDEASARSDILNNLLGVRVDGTNATIIGAEPGSFVADRNDIVRTWCDHGCWPLLVVRLYLDRTGDLGILLEKLGYWKDHLVERTKSVDKEWTEEYGHRQRTRAGAPWEGTVLEHVLLELLSAFYHVGEHGNVLLEGADWNDTYDMARARGESACFTSFYAGDLAALADALDSLASRGTEEVEVLAEALPLLDTLPGQEPVDYSSPATKQERLGAFLLGVRHDVSGEKARVRAADLARDLRRKADSLAEHLRRNEWITTADGESFFNGHYDDGARRVHGDHPNGVRMDLTSQVLPTIFGVATEEQVASAHAAALRYLKDPVTGALRLCTDFKELKLDFGRVTAFTYGYKEHGSVWNQQNAMYAYGLYRRGFVREGFAVLDAVYRACANSRVSKVFPCVPSFIDREGRGGYCYLTGSAAWVVLTTLTQAFGLRGETGDLLIEPKLVREQFDAEGRASAELDFAGRRLRVLYVNPRGLDWGEYRVGRLAVNGAEAASAREEGGARARLPRSELDRLRDREATEIEVELE
jgi:cellobiose phosphorylase